MLIRVHHFSLLYEPSNLPIYFIVHLISGLVRGGVAGAMAGLLSIAKGLAGLPALNPAIPRNKTRNKLPPFVSIFVSCTGRPQAPEHMSPAKHVLDYFVNFRPEYCVFCFSSKKKWNGY